MALENKVNSTNSENNEHIVLNENQLKIFKLLKLKSAGSPDNWPTKEEIAQELQLTEYKVNTTINSLKKIHGMEILVDKNNATQTPRYAMSPRALENTVVGQNHKNFENYCALYLAEPAFGTKAFDDTYTMKGLSLFLKANGYADKISQVIIQGGVIPHVPPFSSKGYDADLKFLGQIPRIENHGKTYSERWLESKISKNPFEKKHYAEYINNDKKKKIVNIFDAFYAAELQIVPLMKIFPENTRLRIQAGEEDRKNIGHIESAYVSAWAKEKETQIQEDLEETEEKLTNLVEENREYIIKKEAIERIGVDKDFLKLKKEKRKDYITRIITKIAPKNSRNKLEDDPLYPVYKESARVIYSITKSADIPAAMASNIAELETVINKNYKKIELNNSLIASLNDTAKWTEQLMGEGRMSAVTWFTNHYPVFASELELIFKKAKDQYSKHVYAWPIEQHPTFHISSRKKITVDTGVIIDVKTGEKDIAEIEYENMNSNKKVISMIHNLNSSFSDNSGSATIKDAKIHSNYNNMVLKKFYSDIETLQQPDIMLLGGHGLGGFRVMPWFKDSENMIPGEFMKGQELSYLIKLPTLQSIPELEKIVGKINNNHTKRYEKGPFGSAAIIHEERADKVNSFTIIDTTKLIEFGKLATEIETYEKYLNNEEVTPEIKLQLQNIVKENYKKIEIAGDFHIGDAGNLDRYSTNSLLKAMQLYQEKNGLPNIVSWDEVLHGTESRIFNSASRYEAKAPEHFRTAIIDPILNDTTLSDKQKLDLMTKESIRNLRAITIPNAAIQLREAKRLLEPYATKILENNGQLILESGNHYNKSTRDSDEATQLATALCALKYIDSKQVHEFSGNGNDVGLGSIRLEGGQKFFGMHKYPVSNDEIYGIMQHLRRMNNNADIVQAGDRHQTGVGYADGHLIVLHPGLESTNKFVPYVGLHESARGFNNAYYDVNKRGVYKVEFILDPTLEKIIEENKIL